MKKCKNKLEKCKLKEVSCATYNIIRGDIWNCWDWNERRCLDPICFYYNIESDLPVYLQIAKVKKVIRHANIYKEKVYIMTNSTYVIDTLNVLIAAHDVKDKQPIYEDNLLIPFDEVCAIYIKGEEYYDMRNIDDRIIEPDLTDNRFDISHELLLKEFAILLDLKYQQ